MLLNRLLFNFQIASNLLSANNREEAKAKLRLCTPIFDYLWNNPIDNFDRILLRTERKVSYLIVELYIIFQKAKKKKQKY